MKKVELKRGRKPKKLTADELTKIRIKLGKIRDSMARLGVSHEEVAAGIGKSRCSVTRWLSGALVSAPIERDVTQFLKDRVGA